MRIARFIDGAGRECYGKPLGGGIAALLEGDIYEGLRETGVKEEIKKLLAPLVPPVIIGIGLNYHGHAEETDMKVPKYPVVFMKNPASLVHPEDPVIIPSVCMDPPEVDYEAELAVVIGKTAKNVSIGEALCFVLGYTAANDVSARRWQGGKGGGQWVRGKSFDTFCPLGPELVTTEDIPDPQDLRISCRLNGQVMQDANTSDMIFTVAELISFLSSGTTLIPGTVILTGTPSGVGFTRKPPVYLSNGDIMEVSVENIGVLRNRVGEKS
ncbi:MAG TPA: 5-carboxymethyl-2-hydroxymuconate isomerase [Desulfobacteraceae bacterium]|nr:5-carboxymethyl-2-hydroxymuconate isomerase [Desulfobacteraceae bacterium]